MINCAQLRSLIIKPALEGLQLYSEDAEELLIFTCAVESDGGTYLHQLNGPALGIYQMEPETHNDIWHNYIHFKGSFSLILISNFDCAYMPSEDRMVYDLRYATAMCRLHYARIKDPIPHKNNVDALWEYYKLHYNTVNGKAQKDRSIAAYNRFLSAT